MNGFGTSDFSVALSNGSLSTYGVKTDLKVPEMVASAGGVLTGVGSILTGIGTVKTANKDDVAQKASSADLEKVKAIISNVKKDLTTVTNIPAFISTEQKSKFSVAATEIQNTERLIAPLNALKAKDIVESIEKVSKNLQEGLCVQEFVECQKFNERFKNLILQLGEAKKILQPEETSSEPTFELYEITADASGNTSYKLVKSS